MNWISFSEPLPFGLITAAASGFLGASFFMLIQLQRRLSEGSLADIRDMWTWRLLILRCIVGVGAASIIYFFFESGLLEGSLWPELEGLGFADVVQPSEDGGTTQYRIPVNRVVPNSNFALLVVWSFVAGYSQTLVPNLLLSTESRQS